MFARAGSGAYKVALNVCRVDFANGKRRVMNTGILVTLVI